MWVQVYGMPFLSEIIKDPSFNSKQRYYWFIERSSRKPAPTPALSGSFFKVQNFRMNHVKIFSSLKVKLQRIKTFTEQSDD